MTILEHTPTREDILDYVHAGIQQLQADGVEARYIVVGPESYTMLRKAIGEQFGRGAGQFETYQYLPIVLDPFRGTSVTVLPAPSECAKGVQTYRTGEAG